MQADLFPKKLPWSPSLVFLTVSSQTCRHCAQTPSKTLIRNFIINISPTFSKEKQKKFPFGPIESIKAVKRRLDPGLYWAIDGDLTYLHWLVWRTTKSYQISYLISQRCFPVVLSTMTNLKILIKDGQLTRTFISLYRRLNYWSVGKLIKETEEMMLRAITVAVFLHLAKSAFARPGNLQSPPPPGKVWMIEMWLFFRLLMAPRRKDYSKFGNTEGNL